MRQVVARGLHEVVAAAEGRGPDGEFLVGQVTVGDERTAASFGVGDLGVELAIDFECVHLVFGVWNVGVIDPAMLVPDAEDLLARSFGELHPVKRAFFIAARPQLQVGGRRHDVLALLIFENCVRQVIGFFQQDVAHPPLGGLASGDQREQRTQVYLNGDVYEEGGVALSVGGQVALQSVISQGCMPIGETWTITRAEGNVIHEIGNQPAYEVLVETFESLSDTEKEKARDNLFVGLVVNEYLEEFHRGDFLVRNLIGVDPDNGAIAIGALPRAGQTLQFQRRDARAAGEDMDELLHRASRSLEEDTIFGGCLCCCNGRGKNLFGAADHDSGLVQHHFGDMGLSGFFCNGEIGPIGETNFLHGYTASLALFVKQEAK